MNLYELNDLIDSIPHEDEEMIKFYKGKRKQLVKDINEDLKAKNLPTINEKGEINERVHNSQRQQPRPEFHWRAGGRGKQ